MHHFNFCFIGSSILNHQYHCAFMKNEYLNVKAKGPCVYYCTCKVKVALLTHLKKWRVSLTFHFYCLVVVVLSCFQGKANVCLFLCRIFLSSTNKLLKLSTKPPETEVKTSHSQLSTQDRNTVDPKGDVSFFR